ncbi:MAG: hypothetical protein AABX83_00690 [Nanoarchaeota archaeon]
MKKQSIVILIIVLVLVLSAFAFMNNKFANSEEKNTGQVPVEEYKDFQTNDDYINAIDETINYIPQ